MTDRPQKRSITLHGHRTSVSLEDAFWKELNGIAKRRERSLSALIMDVDDTRDPEIGLATALRLFVVRDLQSRL